MSDPQASAPGTTVRRGRPDAQPVRLAATLDGPRGRAGPGARQLRSAPPGNCGNLSSPALGEHFRLLRYEHRGPRRLARPARALHARRPGRGRAARCSTSSRSSTRRTAACRWAAWSACGWPRTRPDRIDALALCCTSACLPDTAALGATGPRRSGPAGCRPSPPQVVEPLVHARPTQARSSRRSRRAFVATLERTSTPKGYAGCCEAIAAMDLRPAARPRSPHRRSSSPGPRTRRPRRGTGP